LFNKISKFLEAWRRETSIFQQARHVILREKVPTRLCLCAEMGPKQNMIDILVKKGKDIAMAIETQSIQLAGKAYVVIERDEYERLATLAKAATLPDLPEPDPMGNFPAKEYLRASIARDIVRDRVDAGLSQKELARLAGIRVETLCRIETGKHTPSVASIEKLERALKKAKKRN
jgi:ribosome-binding protein aMBF1 (putative translation factor)